MKHINVNVLKNHLYKMSEHVAAVSSVHSTCTWVDRMVEKLDGQAGPCMYLLWLVHGCFWCVCVGLAVPCMGVVWCCGCVGVVCVFKF